MALLLFSILQDYGSDGVRFFAIVLACGCSSGIYLHIEYSILDYCKSLEIKGREISLFKKGVPIISCRVDDIESIILHRSGAMEGFAFTFLLSDYYYYYRIKLKSGEEIVFSRLIAPKADEFLEQFEGVEIIKKKSFFNSVFWSPQINLDL